MKTLWSCIIFALLLLVRPAVPVSASNHTHLIPKSNWYLDKQLRASDAEDSAIFGYSVAVSGNITVIGAPFHNLYKGAAYVFVREENGNWREEQKLLADDAAAGDRFGKYVAVSGSTALIGSMRGTYFFDRCSGCEQWRQTQPVVNAGGPVSISGDIALIGAHVYIRSGGVWIQEAVLATDDAAIDVCSVSVSGETALIGACHVNSNAGAAYVFVRGSGPNPNSTDSIDDQHWWAQQATLVPDDADLGDQFGYSVSLDGDTALIGAPFDDEKGEDAGAAYIFVRVDGVWKQHQKLFANDAADYQHFGSSVSLDGDTALIGAQWFNIQYEVPGAAYVFRRCPQCGYWYQEYKIPHQGTAASFFGWSVALSGDYALGGAHTDNDDFSGSVYVFRRGNPPPCIPCIIQNLLLKH